MLHGVRLMGFAPVGRVPSYGFAGGEVTVLLQDHRAHGLSNSCAHGDYDYRTWRGVPVHDPYRTPDTGG